MNIFAYFLAFFFALQLTLAQQPSASLDAKVRAKRKSESIQKIKESTSVVPKEALPSLPGVGTPNEEVKRLLPSLPAPITADDGAATLERVKKQTFLDGNLPVAPVPSGDPVELARIKKDACLRMPCDARAREFCPGDLQCSSMPSAREASEKSIITEIRPQIAMMKMAPQQRTIEPVYSLGAVPAYSGPAYSGPAYSSSAYSYPLPSRTLLPSPQMSYVPGMQFHAVLPYAIHHHRPISSHSHNTFEATRGETFDRPEVIYYNAPEPVYVSSHVNSLETSSHENTPLTCYYESQKNKDIKDTGKSLAIPEERANATEDAAINEHIQRVNEMKDEISELNAVAQRIVDQQERLARLHQDHIAMVAAKNVESYSPHMRSLETLMRHESQMRIPPYGMHGGMYRPPYFRSSEEPTQNEQQILPQTVPQAVPQASPQTAPSSPASSPQNMEKPLEKPRGDSPPQVPAMQPMPTMPQRAPEDQVMRQSYPGYYQYPYYRSEPNYQNYDGRYYYGQYPMMRSETGFNVPPLFGKTAQQTPTHEDAKELFKKMFEMGQKMGVISKDFQPSILGPVTTERKNEEATRPENAIDDLMSGSNQKATADEPSKIAIPIKDKRAPKTA